MHRDPWITAEDGTKVFRLFGCSLSPPASGLWPAPGPSAPKGQNEMAQGRANRRPGYAGRYLKSFTSMALRMMLLNSAMSSRSGKTLDRPNGAWIFCVIQTVQSDFSCPSLGIRRCPVVAS